MPYAFGAEVFFGVPGGRDRTLRVLADAEGLFTSLQGFLAAFGQLVRVAQKLATGYDGEHREAGVEIVVFGQT